MTPDLEPAREPLVRRLSAIGLWVLVINGMIGAGIFGVPAEAARLAGWFSPWVFAICGLLLLPVMLCFAELGSYFSGTGGAVLYAGTAFGPMAGFQAGWCLYVGRLLAFAANVNLLVDSVAYFWGGSLGPVLRAVLLLAACAVLTVLNVAGARGTMRTLSTLTVLKLLPLLALVSVGLAKLAPHLFVPSTAAAHDVGAAVLLVVYAYTGFESAPVAAGEARNPQRDLPRALLAALAVCCVLYVLIQSVAVTALPTLASAKRPLLDVAGVLVGPLGVVALAAGVVASVGANLVASMFSVPRITYRLALEGYLPRWFAAVHPAYHTPYRSVIFFGAACFVLAESGSFVWLAGLSVLTRLAVYLCCAAALTRVRGRIRDAPGALRLPGGAAVPVLAMAVCAGLLTQVSAAAYATAAAFLAAGTVLYLLARSSVRTAD